MPKRFIDTELWPKEWFRKLNPAEKAAWFYLLSECDSVGVTRVDRELADYLIGSPVDWEALPQKVNGNLEILPNGKFWLVDFCEFQYGELQENCKPHVSYIALLKKHSLLSLFSRTNKGYGYPIHRVQEKKRKELELEKEEEEAKGSPRVGEPLPNPFDVLHEKFNGKPTTPQQETPQTDGDDDDAF